VSAIAAASPRQAYRPVYLHVATVGILTSAVKLAGAVKVAITAHFFGTADELDAFLIAFLLPSFLSDVFASSITPCLIPLLMRSEQPKQVTREALAFALAIMSGAAAALAVAGHWLLPLAGSSFPAEKLQLASRLMLGLLLWLPMSAFIATWRAVLNTHNRFAVAAIAPLASPLLTIVLLYVFASRWGVAALCAGTVAGTAFEAVVLAIVVGRLGWPVWPAWPEWRKPWMRQLQRQYLPLTLGAVVMSLSTVVDQSFAGRLGAGKISALVYGTKLAGILLAITGSAIGTAVLPSFSQMAASQEWRRLRRALRSCCAMIAAVCVPATLALIAASSFLIRAFFEHGAFKEGATELVSQIQRFALLQAPFAITLAVVSRFTAALSANALLLPAGVAALASNVAFDYAFSRWFGVAGIALAAPFVQAVSLTVLLLLLRRRFLELFAA
jgi:putative peptidoglycan lipid II flippase